MKESLTEEFNISSYDLTPGGEARLTSLANFFQEIAYHHATRLGVGYHDLVKEQIFWVLSRMKIRMLRYPEWDEKIRVETWPCGLDKIFAMRDFRIFSPDGRVSGMASTAWLVVDGRTRRPVRPSGELDQYAEGQDLPFEKRLKKIVLSGDLHSVGIHRVAGSDLDVVGHVNNVKYMEWCIDATGRRGLEQSIGTFEINFMHEALLEDSIEILGTPDNETETGQGVFFLGRREGDQQEIFRAHLVWDHSLSGKAP